MGIAICMKRLCICFAAILFVATPITSYPKQIDVDGTRDVSDLLCPSQRLAAKPTTAPILQETEPPTPDDFPESFLNNQGLLQNKIPLDITKHGDVLTIGIWGDSHSAANFFSDEVISSIVGSHHKYRPTFIPPTMGRGGVRLPIKKYCKSNGWGYSMAYTSKEGDSLPYSPSLVNISNSQSGTSLSIDFRFPDNRPALKSLTILIKPNIAESVINLNVDSNVYENITIPAGDDRITLQSNTIFSIVGLTVITGQITIEGFLPVYDIVADLYLDTYGIPGATMRGWKTIDPTYMKKKLHGHDYDLVILEYGTNEGADRNFDSVTYREMLVAGLKKFKAVFPNSQCVLIGPTDRGVLIKKQGKRNVTKSKQKKISRTIQAKSLTYNDLLNHSFLHQKISDIQSKVAEEFGCKFWSWQTAMGGLGGAYRWYYRSPRLMAKDLIHLTIPGYQESARSFVESLNLKGLFNYK